MYSYLFGKSFFTLILLRQNKSDATQADVKVFSFLIKKITKNSKKQLRNAQSTVITARIISCNLKVGWNIQNKCESKTEVSWSWSNWKIANNFCSAFFQSTSTLSTSKLSIKAMWWCSKNGPSKNSSINYFNYYNYLSTKWILLLYYRYILFENIKTEKNIVTCLYC